jgi:hypothetical protein
MTTITFTPCSSKQADFIESLLIKRDVADAVAAGILEKLADGEVSKAAASSLIDDLLTKPLRPKAKATAGDKRSPMQELLASVPKSKYAIPTEELELTDADDSFTGDLVFLELREYSNTLYMRQLHGAPGGFSRSMLTVASVKAIIAILARDPYHYARVFGEHYACCGSCGAELTDPTSRELQLGPECRKKFGF